MKNKLQEEIENLEKEIEKRRIENPSYNKLGDIIDDGVIDILKAKLSQTKKCIEIFKEMIIRKRDFAIGDIQNSELQCYDYADVEDTFNEILEELKSQLEGEKI